MTRCNVAIWIVCAIAITQPSDAQISRNVTLFGKFTPNPLRYSGSWSYVAPDGHEYGLAGGYRGTHVAAIDDSANIREVGFVAGPESNWREITVVGSNAYVVSEGGGPLAGMQVISLASLPDSVHLVTTYRQTFATGHIIMRDIHIDSAYVYVSGTATTRGVHILNVSNPALPLEVGVYNPGYYVHDAHIRGNRLYASAGGLRQIDIVDISNKHTPTILRSVSYQGSYTHSCWTTDDQKFLFVTDEQDGQVARIWNIENLNSINEVAEYSANLQSIVHNAYIRGRYAFIAHNTEGLRVVDVADPSVPVEVGYYDTYPGPSGGFNGLWSACPYFPSGKIIGVDRTGGMFVWKFNNTRAGRIYGVVRDSLTGAPIDSAQVSIAGIGKITRSNAAGKYKIGSSPDNCSLSFSAAGYVSKIIRDFPLNDGDSLTLNVNLKLSFTGARSGSPLPSQFALHQNYPNPFNPASTITFRIPFTSHVRLHVVDMLGKEIAIMVDEQLPAGEHARAFDARSFPSGIYFYRLKASGFDETKKMVLLR